MERKNEKRENIYKYSISWFCTYTGIQTEMFFFKGKWFFFYREMDFFQWEIVFLSKWNGFWTIGEFVPLYGEIVRPIESHIYWGEMDKTMCLDSTRMSYDVLTVRYYNMHLNYFYSLPFSFWYHLYYRFTSITSFLWSWFLFSLSLLLPLYKPLLSIIKLERRKHSVHRSSSASITC